MSEVQFYKIREENNATLYSGGRTSGEPEMLSMTTGIYDDIGSDLVVHSEKTAVDLPFLTPIDVLVKTFQSIINKNAFEISEMSKTLP